jgi:hypothetical protein
MYVVGVFFQLTDKTRTTIFIGMAWLMTLSSRVSTFGGIVIPICFADFRFITNPNFIGCSTGRSAGLAPFKFVHVIGGAAVVVREVHSIRHEATNIYDVQHGKPKPAFADMWDALIVEHTTEIKQISKTMESNR